MNMFADVLVPVVVISVLIFLNGLFVAAEFAIVAVPRPRMAQLAERGSRAAKLVLNTLRNPDLQNFYLATAQVGITLVSLGLGMYGEHTVAEWLVKAFHGLGHLAAPTAHAVASVLAVGLLTYLHVVLGEMVPKSIALQHAEQTALRLAFPMEVIGKLFWPIVAFLNTLGNLVTRALGIPPADFHTRLFSIEEIEYLVEESYEQGLLEWDEHLFIENIFDLSERVVGQVMTPRTRIVGLPADADRRTIIRTICEKRFSRYPVYEGNLDNIVGVVHVKKIARQIVRHEGPLNLREIADPPFFVPESLSLDKMLAYFRQKPVQIAIVFDEYGGTAGLVTVEDIVEEVVGEIQDEFSREIPPIKELGDGRLQVRGDVLLDELNQLYDLDLDHPEADTVGGLIMAELGRVPRPGDTVEYGGVRFTVEAVEGLAVQTVRCVMSDE